MFNQFLRESIIDKSANDYVPTVELNEKTYLAFKKFAFNLPMNEVSIIYAARYVILDDMEDEVAEVY